jgi:MOSC domain-containing protein YiiM
MAAHRAGYASLSLSSSVDEAMNDQPEQNADAHHLGCQIKSINIGPRVEVDIFGQKKLTAYEKHPVEHDVFVDENGIVGDGHYAREAEEGKDHAVQICSEDNYAFWTERLNKNLRLGVFGESITYGGPDEFSVRIGDVAVIGDITLEITGPRIPCAKLAHFIGEDISFPRTYHQTSRTGMYARVLTPGRLSTSNRMKFQSTGAKLPFVSEIAAALLQRDPDQNWMKAMIDEPILSIMIRNMYVKKLEAVSRRR